MSNPLKIKLSIADRVYPLTIAPNQEEGLRKAALRVVWAPALWRLGFGGRRLPPREHSADHRGLLLLKAFFMALLRLF